MYFICGLIVLSSVFCSMLPETTHGSTYWLIGVLTGMVIGVMAEMNWNNGDN